ncbi:hypothetical protein GCM10009736_68920 [Actinomadura bangladeshensis]
MRGNVFSGSSPAIVASSRAAITAASPAAPSSTSVNFGDSGSRRLAPGLTDVDKVEVRVNGNSFRVRPCRIRIGGSADPGHARCASRRVGTPRTVRMAGLPRQGRDQALIMTVLSMMIICQGVAAPGCALADRPLSDPTYLGSIR